MDHAVMQPCIISFDAGTWREERSGRVNTEGTRDNMALALSSC